ncbi:MAG: hypothetical protein ACYCYO_16045 [Bacilli bacterium]
MNIRDVVERTGIVMGTALVLTGVFLATLRKSAGLPAVPAPEEVG